MEKIFCKALLSTIVTLLFGCTTVTIKQADSDAVVNSFPEHISNYDVKHYEIRVTLDDAEKKVVGKVKITLKSKIDNFKQIELDAADMTFSETSVNNIKLKYHTEGQKLFIDLDKEYRKDALITVAIAYTVNNPRKGLTFINPYEGYDDKLFQIWTQGEGEDNHYWFPCWDYPNMKATTEVYATVPSKYVAISNGELVNTSKDDNGMTTYHWCENFPHVTYLVTLVVGEFNEYRDEFKRGDQIVPVYYYMPKDKYEPKYAWRTYKNTPEMMVYFSNILVDYPYEKYAQNTVYDFGGGMENTSATTMTERIILNEFSDEWENSDGIISHELAHQWSGDLLTCKNWGNIWLNEGFATYFQKMWTEYKYGADEINFEFMNTQQGHMSDANQYRKPLCGPKELCDVYGKGSIVLNMLRHIMGDEAFWKGMKIYFKENYGKCVITKNFQDAMEKAYGKSLSWFFDEWVYGYGYPMFEVTYKWDEEQKILHLNVKQGGSIKNLYEETISSKRRCPVINADSSVYEDPQRIKQLQKADDTIPIFKTPVDVRIDAEKEGKIDRYDYRIWVDKAEQDFCFPLPSKPVLVDFDEYGWLVKKLILKKDVEELIYEAKNGDEPCDRIWAVNQLGDVRYRDKEKAVPALREVLLMDKFYGVKSAAAGALGKLRGLTDLYALLEGYKDNDGRVRSAVISNLGNFQSEDVSDFIVEVLNNDKANNVRISAASALGRFKSDSYDAIVDALKKCDKKNKRLVNALLASLIETEKTEAIPLLMEYSKEKMVYWQARQTAINGIARLGKGNPDAINHLIDLLKDTNDNVIVSAANALGEIGSRDVIPQLEAALKYVQASHTETGMLIWRGNPKNIENAIEKIRKR